MLKEKTESREVNGSQSPEAEKKSFCFVDCHISSLCFLLKGVEDFDFQKKRVSLHVPPPFKMKCFPIQ